MPPGAKVSCGVKGGFGGGAPQDNSGGPEPSGMPEGLGGERIG